jgi:hypothetical protein
MNDTMQTIAERMAELEAEVCSLRATREELQEEVSRLAGLLATEAERAAREPEHLRARLDVLVQDTTGACRALRTTLKTDELLQLDELVAEAMARIDEWSTRCADLERQLAEERAAVDGLRAQVAHVAEFEKAAARADEVRKSAEALGEKRRLEIEKLRAELDIIGPTLASYRRHAEREERVALDALAELDEVNASLKAERERCAEIERNAALRSTEVVEWQRSATEAEQRGREAERGAVVWHIREEADRQGLQMCEVLTTLADRLKRGAHVGTAAAGPSTAPAAEHAAVNPPVSAAAAALAQLRHAYHLGLQGSIGDQRAFVDHLVAPAVRVLEAWLTPSAEPQPAPIDRANAEADAITARVVRLLATPQPESQRGHTAVVPVLVEATHARAAAGMVKYKMPLEAGNGRDALVDAAQESIDQAVYHVQALVQREHARARLRAAIESYRASGDHHAADVLAGHLAEIEACI